MIFRFEAIDESLGLLPLAARRALDAAGAHLSLAAWRQLALAQRKQLVEAGAGTTVAMAAVRAALGDTPTKPIEADHESRLGEPPARAPADVVEAWPSLAPLARFALHHVFERSDTERQRTAVAELVPKSMAALTHLDERGQARMVEVGEKAITQRIAVAGCEVRMKPDTARRIADRSGPKGDVLAVARVAGITAAKKTPDLIPLCHGIALTKVTVDFDVDGEAGSVSVRATAHAMDRTGVEMEAMVAASVAALTIYDMVKAVEREVTIEHVRLVEKRGGRSGHYRREASP